MKKASFAALALALTFGAFQDSWAAGRTSVNLAATSNLINNIDSASIGSVPVGTIIAWPSTSNPSDMAYWLECKGQTITQAAYPELFAVVGSQVPDYRGYFLRGNGGNSAALGVAQSDAIRNITGNFVTESDFEHPGNINGAFRDKGITYYGLVHYDRGGFKDLSWVEFDASRSVPTANENRPINKSVRYLIRAKS